MDIIKILHEIAQNEHENFKAFKERLTDYCTNRENGVIIEKAAWLQCARASS